MNRMHVMFVSIFAAALALLHGTIASRIAGNHNQTRLVR